MANKRKKKVPLQVKYIKEGYPENYPSWKGLPMSRTYSDIWFNKIKQDIGGYSMAADETIYAALQSMFELGKEYSKAGKERKSIDNKPIENVSTNMDKW